MEEMKYKKVYENGEIEETSGFFNGFFDFLDYVVEINTLYAEGLRDYQIVFETTIEVQ